jgi:hypothetical protein
MEVKNKMAQHFFKSRYFAKKAGFTIISRCHPWGSVVAFDTLDDQKIWKGQK